MRVLGAQGCGRRAEHARRGVRAGAAPGSPGLTLIELLLVMGLIAVVMGTGLGAFASLDPGRRAALGLVKNVLRTAHNTAIARRAPARVRIDPASGEIVAEGMLVVGTWHFEDENLEGGDGLHAVAVGVDGVLDGDGWIGSGVDLSGAPRGARIEVAVQDDPAFDPRLGFSVQFAVRPRGSLGTARLFALGDVVTIESGVGGTLRASLRRRVLGEFGRTAAGGRVVAETGPGAVRAGRWSVVTVQYDRRALRIAVDGVPLARTESEDEVARLDGPLTLGGGGTPPRATIDELVVAVAAGEARGKLPSSVRFAAGVPRVIDFGAGGALDPRRHPEPPVVALEFDDGEVETLRISRYGTVE